MMTVTVIGFGNICQPDLQAGDGGDGKFRKRTVCRPRLDLPANPALFCFSTSKKPCKF